MPILHLINWPMQPEYLMNMTNKVDAGSFGKFEEVDAELTQVGEKFT